MPNPIQWVDPLGLSCKEDGAGLGNNLSPKAPDPLNSYKNPTANLTNIYGEGTQVASSRYNDKLPVHEVGNWGPNLAIDGGGGMSRSAVKPPKLHGHMRVKYKKIEGFSSKPGMHQVTGRVTEKESRVLAERFVGTGYKETITKKGTWQLKSADGLRKVRGPALKPTNAGKNVHPVSKQPFSETGKQMNFETRYKTDGRYPSNIHLDVK